VAAYLELRGEDAAPGTATAYRITVRQLEALVRLSEALARVFGSPCVRPSDVLEVRARGPGAAGRGACGTKPAALRWGRPALPPACWGPVLLSWRGPLGELQLPPPASGCQAPGALPLGPLTQPPSPPPLRGLQAKKLLKASILKIEQSDVELEELMGAPQFNDDLFPQGQQQAAAAAQQQGQQAQPMETEEGQQQQQPEGQQPEGQQQPEPAKPPVKVTAKKYEYVKVGCCCP
jgi:hypothetical protein